MSDMELAAHASLLSIKEDHQPPSLYLSPEQEQQEGAEEDEEENEALGVRLNIFSRWKIVETYGHFS